MHGTLVGPHSSSYKSKSGPGIFQMTSPPRLWRHRCKSAEEKQMSQTCDVTVGIWLLAAVGVSVILVQRIRSILELLGSRGSSAAIILRFVPRVSLANGQLTAVAVMFPFIKLRGKTHCLDWVHRLRSPLLVNSPCFVLEIIKIYCIALYWACCWTTFVVFADSKCCNLCDRPGTIGYFIN